ncbi:hypothetical protein [Arthrobacter sp. NicSoilB11]|uniref:hypothetical protein n=1 Tax=Arthrobacter sp. NicSoilB11 TaxID=2830999 RepID=UPI001CC629B7|nr:hypothetical protein [Arthrobacter sp. NicSoilB11]BCW75454.1 hypothetical protein NicSoilB11_17790 [Arthrobacter sp. NicSoilB11]
MVIDSVGVRSGRSTSCQVTLRFILDGTPHTTKVVDPDPGSYLPAPGSDVDLVYDPKELSGVLIAGREVGSGW